MSEALSAHYTIAQGKSLRSPDNLTVADLNIAAGNFQELRRYIIAALPNFPGEHSKPPEECLALVLALPNLPNEKNDPNSGGSAPQKDKPARPNKKAYRAEQAAKKAKKKAAKKK